MPLKPTPALLLTFAGVAHAAPATFTGDWYAGTVFPQAAYTLAGFRQATTDGQRLRLNAAGTYELVTLEKSATPETFGWTTRIISCEKISVRLESGRYGVQGNKLTLTPSAVKVVRLATPERLNSTCTRFAGRASEEAPTAARAFTWTVTGTRLNLSGTPGSMVFQRASALKPADPTPPTVSVPAPRPTPIVAPVRTDGSGRWAGRFTSAAGAPLDVKLNVEDDRLGIQGMVLSPTDQWLGTVEGDHRGGTLTLTIRMPDGSTLELRVQGKFQSDTFTGRFQAVTAAGAAIGEGEVILRREPLPQARR